MASNEPPRIDDSEDEEDFNPAPADLSDEEPADHDTSPPSSKAKPRRRNYGEGDDGEDDQSPRKANAIDSDDENGEQVPRVSRRRGDEDDDQNDEDDEEERDQDEEEDEEEDDEDEDIQQVSVFDSPLPTPPWLFSNFNPRVIVGNVVVIDVTPSLI